MIQDLYALYKDLLILYPSAEIKCISDNEVRTIILRVKDVFVLRYALTTEGVKYMCAEFIKIEIIDA